MNERWIGAVRKIIEETNGNISKLDNADIASRIHSTHGLLVSILVRQRIIREFSDSKHMRELKKVVEKTIPAIIDDLFMILDKRSDEEKDDVISSILRKALQDEAKITFNDRFVAETILAIPGANSNRWWSCQRND